MFSKIRSWLAVPVVALASFAIAPAHAQLTCESPLDVGLGVTEFATLLQFPERQVVVPCVGTQTVHHAVYLRFTAPQDGWYALHAVPASQDWRARMGVMPSCDVAAEAVFAYASYSAPFCSSGDWSGREYASVTVYLLSGESRIIAVGGETVNDSGAGELHAVRIGDTLMDGAQQLALGSNSYTVTGLEPSVPYQGACSGWWDGRMRHASRFTFTPAKTGSYRFNFCGSNRYYIALSDSPNMPYASLATSYGGCPNGGGRLTATLIAGTTYYIVVGHSSNYDYCTTPNVVVEYFDPCPADLNDDDSTDGKDLAMLISGWGTADTDITGDGYTDGVDLGILLAYWGPCSG